MVCTYSICLVLLKLELRIEIVIKFNKTLRDYHWTEDVDFFGFLLFDYFVFNMVTTEFITITIFFILYSIGDI